MKKILGRRPFKHLGQKERDRIEGMLEVGFTQTSIAKVLGVHKSTLSRELERKRVDGRYEALNAEHKAGNKRRASKYQGMKIEKYPKLREYLISELQKKRSPDEIAGRMKLLDMSPRIGGKAIYRWLYSSHGQAYCRYLCTKRYRIKKQTQKVKRMMIKDRVSVTERPLLGIHAEGDLFVSSRRSGTVRSGALLCIQSTKLMVGKMIVNRRPLTMTKAVNHLVEDLPITDITLDNGIENKDHRHWSIPAYFADPHAPWQKPLVESSIGLLRRWFIPKRTDLTKVSEKQYQEYLHILNGKYRKSLGYCSAYEVSLERGMIQKIPIMGTGSH
jgi:IS30 family transposase